MASQAGPALTWEEKAALGCVGLLALQTLHELAFAGKSLGTANAGPGSLLFLPIAFLVAIAVIHRRRAVWWWGALVLGGIGLMLLALYWQPLRRGLGLEIPPVRSQRFGLDGFGLLWSITRIGLYLAGAMLLVVGRIRERVRSR
jgi:hypothetical protein